MANTKRTLVVEIEVSIGTQDGDVLRYIEMMNGVCDAVMYENDSIDVLRDVGTRMWAQGYGSWRARTTTSYLIFAGTLRRSWASLSEMFPRVGINCLLQRLFPH